MHKMFYSIISKNKNIQRKFTYFALLNLFKYIYSYTNVLISDSSIVYRIYSIEYTFILCYLCEWISRGFTPYEYQSNYERRTVDNLY